MRGRPTIAPTSVLDNTAFGSNQTALPGPFTLPFKSQSLAGVLAGERVSDDLNTDK